jgi:uncharacterized protein YbjQ (UPF0145 family)
LSKSGEKNLTEKRRWGVLAVIIGFVFGFLSAYLCIIWHLVIFGFNIMYIVSPLLAGFVETIIARKKYGKSTGAISALLTFLLINIYGWFLPGYLVDPTKEPATLSLITIIAIVLTLQAAFPTLINYILSVVALGSIIRFIESLVTLPMKLRRNIPLPEGETEILTPPADEIFLEELKIPIVSVPDLNGDKINRYLGLVVGEAISEEKETNGRLSKINRIIEPIPLEDMNLGDARKSALSKMLENAESMGANAVVEVLFDYVSMGGLQGSVILVTATGTAVVVESDGKDLDENISDRGFTSGISEKINIPVSSEEIQDVDERELGKYEESIDIKLDPSTSDYISNKIGYALNKKSDQVLRDWDLVQEDLKRFNENRIIKNDFNKIDKEFGQYRDYTDNQIHKVHSKLDQLKIK